MEDDENDCEQSELVGLSEHSVNKVKAEGEQSERVRLYAGPACQLSKKLSHIGVNQRKGW